MQIIKISIFCTIIAFTTACDALNSDDIKSEQKAEISIVSNDKKMSAKFKKDLEMLHRLNKRPVKISKRIYNFLNQYMTIKEGCKVVLTAAALVLFIAIIKFDFFPSEEQKKFKAHKGPNVGPTGLSIWSEASIINLLTMIQRKF